MNSLIWLFASHEASAERHKSFVRGEKFEYVIPSCLSFSFYNYKNGRHVMSSCHYHRHHYCPRRIVFILIELCEGTKYDHKKLKFQKLKFDQVDIASSCNERSLNEKKKMDAGCNVIGVILYICTRLSRRWNRALLLSLELKYFVDHLIVLLWKFHFHD